MAALQLWALVVLLHTSSANLYCEHILRLSAEVHELKENVKTLMAERIELQRKVEILSVNRSAVAFTVRFVSDDSINGISIGPSQVLKFDHVMTNIGGGYDYRTGIFTAPVAGVYVFYQNAMSTNGRGYVVLAIDKHGTILAMSHGNGSADPEDQGSTQVVTHLTAGEQVWVRQHAGDAVRGGEWTVFTGYLISPD